LHYSRIPPWQGHAQAAGLSGWVRNRLDGTVEALIAGETAAVEELVLCAAGDRGWPW